MGADADDGAAAAGHEDGVKDAAAVFLQPPLELLQLRQPAAYKGLGLKLGFGLVRARVRVRVQKLRHEPDPSLHVERRTVSVRTADICRNAAASLPTPGRQLSHSVSEATA